MKRAVLAVISVVFAAACATRPAPQPLHYAIDNDVLRFEHDGAMYVVTDAATVQEATSAAKGLFFSLRAVAREHGAVPSDPVYYDSRYRATTGSTGIPPVQHPTPEEREASQGHANLMDNSLRFADITAEAQTQIRDFESEAARGAKRLQEIFDRSVRSGLAHRVN